MAISITDRPSKTLSNGFLSKWSSSELPLQYKLTNDLYPNSYRSPVIISSLFYVNDKNGTRLIVSDISANGAIFVNRTVLIEGTGTDLDGGTYPVKEIVSNTEIILDVRTEETSSTGTANRVYANYKGLVKVFAGSPDQHPYNIDGSKPLEEIGVIEVDFKDINGVNVGYADVRGYIKAAINAKFDTDENTHFGWSSYSVEIAEIFSFVDDNGDQSISGGNFEPDVEPTCDPAPVTFLNPSFDTGLSEWTRVIRSANGISYAAAWTAGTGTALSSFTQGNTVGNYTQIMYQDVNLYAGIPYLFDIDVQYTGNTSISIIIADEQAEQFGNLRISSSGTYQIEVTTSKNITNVGVAFGSGAFSIPVTITLNSFQVSTNVDKHCLYTQFATFGAKQFQDSLGGNFGDYVLNVVDTVTPKVLTHFDSKTFFKGKPFYFSGIIPASTFSLSEGGNNVFIDANLDNGQSIRVPVINSGEGVYTVDLEPYLLDVGDWSNGTAQFIIIPTNTFVDGDNGTFEDADVPNWNISSLNVLADNVDVSGTSRTGTVSAGFNVGGGLLSQGETELYKFNSPIKTIIGLDYVFNAYYYFTNSFNPTLNDKAYIYFKIEGTSITTNKYLLNTTKTNDLWKHLSLTFTPTTETVNIIMCIESLEEISSGGGLFPIDDVTFKGPIEYISEVKPITNSKECDRYGGTLRWLNDLNGWETWNFTKKKIVKEKVAKKIDVINDYSNDWDNSFINGETQRDTIQTTVNKSIVLRSQLLNTNQKTILEQIKRSARVQYLTDANKWQTVTVRASAYDVIDEEEKIHDMEIEINLPDLIIQAQ